MFIQQKQSTYIAWNDFYAHIQKCEHKNNNHFFFNSLQNRKVKIRETKKKKNVLFFQYNPLILL